MKAAVYYENGPPRVLRYEDVADPIPKANEVLIHVEAISIEGGDVLRRFRMPPDKTPYIVGYQAAGEVIAVGADVTKWKVGDRVVTINVQQGSHAELQTASQDFTWSIPKGFDLLKAAAMPVGFGTAHECLFEQGRLKRGETVLIQSGASGVGIPAIQLAKQAGARVIATASSAAKLEKLKALGMDEGINSSEQDVVETVKSLTGGKGVDVVVDPVGGSVLQASLKCLAYRGRVSWVGSAGRESATVDLSALSGGNKSVTGVFLEAFAPRGEAMIQDLINQAARGELQVVIDKVFPLAEAAAAHAYIESRVAVGRVMMKP